MNRLGTRMLTAQMLGDRDALNRLLLESFPPGIAPVMLERFRRIVPMAYEDPDARAVLIWIPGRIEVLGKHTDYAGGVSMTCASRRGIAAIALEKKGDISLSLEDLADDVRARILPDEGQAEGRRQWVRYPRVVLSRVQRHFGRLRTGVHIVFESDIPRASGMSSSSGMIVMTYLALAAIADFSDDPAFRRHIRMSSDVAAFLGAIESGADFGALTGDRGVGTRGGSQDHTAILFSEEGQLSVFGYDPVGRLAQVTLPQGLTFVIATSGVKARKSGAAGKQFNMASDLSGRIAAAWSKDRGRSYPTLGHMIEDPELDEPRLMEVLDEIAENARDRERLWQRFAQFHDECVTIIPAAVEALTDGDLEAFGLLVDRSQELAGTWLHNQIPETQFLAQSARESGALASSSFGAGYGGAVWALVPSQEAQGFTKSWNSSFATAYPDRLASAHFFNDRPSCGARVLGADVAKLRIDTIPKPQK